MKRIILVFMLLQSFSAFSQAIRPEDGKILTEEEMKALGYKDAQFPGGINTFRNNFARIFDGSRIRGNGIFKSELQFVINEEDFVTEIITTGDNKSMNKEMERTAKSLSKTKWVPAEIDGKPVKFKFRLPITMNFSN